MEIHDRIIEKVNLKLDELDAEIDSLKTSVVFYVELKNKFLEIKRKEEELAKLKDGVRFFNMGE
jgi:hypothetical protein